MRELLHRYRQGPARLTAPARVRHELCQSQAGALPDSGTADLLIVIDYKATLKTPLTKLLMPIEKVGDEKPLSGEGVACAF